MASNLRAEFRERQHKRLSKSIDVNPTPFKKDCPEPASAPMPVSVPPATAPTVTPKLDEKIPSIDDVAHHETRRPFIGPDNFSEESFQYMTFSLLYPKSTYVPNWEEVSELLKRIPSFIERELLVQNMGGAIFDYLADLS